MTEEPQTQINQGEIEVADNSEFDFDFDPDNEDLSLRSESDAAPTKRSFMWMWWVLAAVLFTTFAVFLSSASVGIVAHNQAQASVKESSGSKSGKSKCSKRSYVRRLKDADFEDDEVVSNTDIVDRELDSFNDDDCEDSDSNSNAEEPDGDAVRAKYEGTVALGNLDCGSEEEEEECVQSVQNALKAALEEVICRDLTDPLVSPCWVVVDPTPEVEVAVEGVTDEAGRRRLDLQSLWTFIASMTIAGPSDTEDNMDSTIASASAAISDVVVALAEAVGGNIEVILEAVAQVFKVLAVELSPDPYDWAAVIPDVTGYQLVGEGYCTSSLGEYYDGVQYTASSVLACVTKCKGSVCFAENSWTLVGVELEGSDCYCLINGGYESGDSCTDPDARFEDYGPGTGQPWFSGPDGQDDGALCFRLIQ
eukprot:CAMPEP_0113409512 /NCGR_PEP_ID=MMETSP0013_2-20120614/21184_1 /TAXON_ID=2843 ORGANISM="Skeletonema costatum, Strain 1716" /NCGR_SAMPLE_ID=MMETSP0013_2 /ASSEMBLY_ACC=CAM_ASM_000158 /LENGTH=421 /DNA_ID=CAMNT_0000295629 /DNA_START=42 /DNA_END=1307 /DNA_ORIENTATION=+ /assembly_acc=CAM_ASM_000158